MCKQVGSMWLIWLAIAAVLFTAFVIQHSFERGRLQYPVDYEDVITHLDGLKRYRALVDEGQGRLQFLSHYAVDPPHAPLHSLQAMLAFAFLGIHDWAPYVSNVVLLFALLAALVFATRDCSGWARAAAVAFILCTPLAYHSVEEFRPDYPSAIATVWGILLYIRFLKTGSPWLAGLAGACYGLAMLAKPPVFPYILAMGGGPFFWGLLRGFQIEGWHGFRKHAASAWPFFAACAVVAGPHFLVAARHIIDYFVLNQLGADSHLWAFNQGWRERIAYHVTGYGGWLGLGRHWGLALLLWAGAVGAGIYEVRRRGRAAGLLLWPAAMTVWAYLFLVVNPHMNPFFGITFQILLLFTAAALLTWLVDSGSRQWTRSALRVGVLAVLGIAFLLAFRLPVRKIEFTFGPEGHREFLRSASGDVMNILEKYRNTTEGRYCLVSSYGAVSSHTLQWISDKNERGFQFFGVTYEPIEKVREMFDVNHGPARVDFAIVSEPGILGVHEFLPNAKTSGPLLEYLQEHGEYVEIGRVPDPNGKSYIIFRRERLSPASNEENAGDIP
jgi:hypothetical protein